jgi:hypothetical protein
MQNIGPRQDVVLERRNRLIQQRIPRNALFEPGHQTGFGGPSQLLAAFGADLSAKDAAGQERKGRRVFRWRKAIGLGLRRRKMDQQRFAQEALARHRKPAIHHANQAIGSASDEALRKHIGRHQFRMRPEQAILDHLEIDVDHNAKQAVATDRKPKQFGVLGIRTRDQRPVGEHQAKTPDGAAERPERHRPAVCVDAQRAAHAEIMVGLRDR